LRGELILYKIVYLKIIVVLILFSNGENINEEIIEKDITYIGVSFVIEFKNGPIKNEIIERTKSTIIFLKNFKYLD